MDLEERMHSCRKSLDEIKASQLLGESNYQVYTYTGQDEFVATGDSSWSEFWFKFEYKSDIDAFTIASFDIEFYVNDQRETFGACTRGISDWEYQSNLFPSLSYEYGINQYTGYINIGRIQGNFYSYAYDSSETWAGKRVKLIVRVKASRPGSFTVTHQ